jgi:hypothetical protein
MSKVVLFQSPANGIVVSSVDDYGSYVIVTMHDKDTGMFICKMTCTPLFAKKLEVIFAPPHLIDCA